MSDAKAGAMQTQDLMGGDFYSRNFEKGAQEHTIILNLGPQHPSTHGVLRVLVELDGEYIVRAEPILGYLHRMHEKMAEVHTAVQYMPDMGRVDYLNAMAWNWAYAGAVERLAGIEVSKRAEYVRVILAELNRICSHLVWWGAYVLDLGGVTPILYGFDDREHILDLVQMLSGARMTYSNFRFGGLRADATPHFCERVLEFIPYMRGRLDMYRRLVTGNMILRHRLEGVGIIDADMCRRYGATGPMVRGCGLPYDLRRDQPYSVYCDFEFEIPTHDSGCCMGRYLVRLDEIAQSLNIVEQAVKQLPEGSAVPEKLMKFGTRLPAGQAHYAVEGARGVVGVWVVSDGGKNTYRVKLRAPGFSNLSCFAEAAQGTLLADAVAILGSLDLVIPEVDR